MPLTGPILNLDLFVTPEYDYAVWSPSSPRTAEKALVTPALRSMEPPAARSSISNLLGCVPTSCLYDGSDRLFPLFSLGLCPEIESARHPLEVGRSRRTDLS